MTSDIVEALLRMKYITPFDEHGILMTNLLHQITCPHFNLSFKLYVYGRLR